MRLRKLFEFVGDHFGIAVEVITTDGRQPIGNGIGPVLEAQDVMAVLANDPAAPKDLREKSLRLAAHLLDYDPELRGGKGYTRARELLDSGAALKQMQKIIDAQGPSGCSTEPWRPDRRNQSAARRRGRGDRLPAAQPTGAHRRRADRQRRRHHGRSKRSANASSRASRSTASMPLTTRSSNSRSPRPRATMAISSGRARRTATNNRERGHAIAGRRCGARQVTRAPPSR